MKTSHLLSFSKIPKTYDSLVAFLPLRPIHDRVGLDNATEITDAMAGHNLSPDQEDYFDVLTTLIDQYERESMPQPQRKHDPLGNLSFLMEQRGLNASELGRLLGQRELGSKILRGTRQLSKANIIKLADYFHVSPACFL